MLAERTREGSDLNADSGGDSVGTSIRDPEIVQIAVFKLRECAARLETLADAGQESPLCEQLRSIGAELRRMEVDLLRRVRRGEK
jgi:hypothetical protein